MYLFIYPSTPHGSGNTALSSIHRVLSYILVESKYRKHSSRVRLVLVYYAAKGRRIQVDFRCWDDQWWQEWGWVVGELRLGRSGSANCAPTKHWIILSYGVNIGWVHCILRHPILVPHALLSLFFLLLHFNCAAQGMHMKDDLLDWP